MLLGFTRSCFGIGQLLSFRPTDADVGNPHIQQVLPPLFRGVAVIRANHVRSDARPRNRVADRRCELGAVIRGKAMSRAIAGSETPKRQGVNLKSQTKFIYPACGRPKKNPKIRLFFPRHYLLKIP
jgi:hypothetical protein